MAQLKYDKTGRVLFTKEMKTDYTLLFPMMAPIHFTILKNVLTSYGYKAELLTTTGPEIAQVGLKYVHNDTCYPAILVIGQLIDALKSGKYDINKTALMITQTGGGCRASNYIHLLRKALKRAGFEKVPVVSVNLYGMEHNSGFKITLPMLRKFIAAFVYGDALMLLKNQVKPYEIVKGSTDALVEKWVKILTDMLNRGDGYTLKQLRMNLNKISDDFADIKVKYTPKIKVGVVGEIYVKYAALGNNNLESFLENQACEVNMPGILSFGLYSFDTRLTDIKLYGGSNIKYFIVNKSMKYLLKIENVLIESIKRHKQFVPPASFEHIKSLAGGVIGHGSKMGEGWLLTAEMLELIESGYENIVCTQPFGCLPNHICGKGMFRTIKKLHSNSNIVAIDYDAGAAKVNQENRIKLMLSIAKENLEKKGSAQRHSSENTENNKLIKV